MQTNTRSTIGFLSANIHIGSSRVLWPGVIDAAQAHDANLICYPGGRLHAAEEFEAERNIIYQFVNTDLLDGLVSWTSALAGTASAAEVASLHAHYHPLPIVSLAWPLAQGALVSINGYQGMHDLVSHLVDMHDYRRVVLIRGPEGHPYALERYHAYLDVLKEKGLDPDPALIAPALGWQKGAQAMRVLLDERGLRPGADFQAVVAVSDLLAIGAINMMAERGIRVPGDVAVVGFNDIEEGRLVRPALTSVSLPFYEQGRQAVNVLLNRLQGREAPAQVMLDSQLLVRQSCGCPSQSVHLAAAEPADAPTPDLRAALKRTQEELTRQIAPVISSSGVAATWAKQLVDAFRAELDEGTAVGTAVATGSRFRSALDGMLQQGVLDGDETAAWQGAISVLRRELLPVLNDRQQLRAEGLLGQARVVIGEAIQRAQIGRQLHVERQNNLLRDIGQALITTFDVDRLADVLAERLPDLGIKSCYLALYENPAESTEFARLKLAYTDGCRADWGPDGRRSSDRRFPAHQLIPADLLPTRRYALLVEPLYFQTEPLGFVVFEIGPRDGAVYEVLRGHISTALKGALLFQETQAARLAAERADQIKTRLLANVSHELRTPLNIIIGHTQRLLATPDTPSPALAQDLGHIQHSAEHQLRLINDLLDVSRAEIDELDLYPVLLPPRPLLEEAFVALAEDVAAGGAVSWRLDLPPSLPVVYADPVRLRQMLLNLLSNAARFTPRGQITLGAEALPSHLHVWVADTGIGISPELADRIYDPFFTHEQGNQPPGGIGLGLAITKHLVALHEGRLTVESEPEHGSTFHVYLPLPVVGEQVRAPSVVPTAVLWFISQRPNLPTAVTAFSTERQLRIRRIGPQDNVEMLLADELPAVIAWDVVHTLADDWQLVRRLHNHPRLSQTPFVLYQPDAAREEATAGLTSLVVKPASSQALWAAIQPALPGEMARTVRGSVLVVDDDPQARDRAVAAVEKGLPGHGVRTAVNGADGLAAALADPPDLIILDLMMPVMDGFDVLERLRTDERTRQIPVIILSGRQLTLADVKRLERFTAVTLHNKGVLTPEEIAISLHRALFDDETLPPQTSALVRQAIAYLHQNYGRSLTRREIAAELGMSEDYLSRAFSQELGLSPWDYLNRYRVAQARDLLRHTPDSVTVIGRRVGFQDPAYFSRVFRRIVGVSPNAYRQGDDR